MSIKGNTLFTTGQEIEVIAGHMFDMEYDVVLKDTAITPVDLLTPGLVIEWKLSPHGYKTMVLIEKTNANSEIEVNVGEHNVFTVHVLTGDTDNLDGVYTYQVTIIDPSGKKSRPFEGQIVIRSRI